MAKRRTVRDPLEAEIEDAFQPSEDISYYDGGSFVWDLERVADKIAALVSKEPARAVALYEALIAGCNDKAEEVDDSDLEFTMFASGLFCLWIKARQAADLDRDETAMLLLGWMDDDPYEFCDGLEDEAVKVLDRAGLEAFERQVLTRFAEPNSNYAGNRWARMLRAIYSQQRDIAKYLHLIGETATTKADCEAIATMFQSRRKLNDALLWVERGLGIKQRGIFGGGGHRLGEMRRALLVKLGRGGEALDSAWVAFKAHPDKDTYAELIRYVPKTERRVWHEKAMDAAQKADLSSLIKLWLSAKEIGRLAERLDRASNAKLETLSHRVTEPAAERLAKTHPAVAAKVFRALCMRIVDAGESKYYVEALFNLEKAKICYLRAGLDTQWQALVAQIRRDHHRKTGFIPGLERIIRGTVRR